MSQEGKYFSKSINYTDDQIQKIEILVEGIRRRPGMYFGDVHIKSFTHNLRAIVIDCFEETKASTFSLLLRDELMEVR